MQNGEPEAQDAARDFLLDRRYLLSSAVAPGEVALLPRGAAPDWDSLMVSERYMQALSLLP